MAGSRFCGRAGHRCWLCCPQERALDKSPLPSGPEVLHLLIDGVFIEHLLCAEHWDVCGQDGHKSLPLGNDVLGERTATWQVFTEPCSAQAHS